MKDTAWVDAIPGVVGLVVAYVALVVGTLVKDLPSDHDAVSLLPFYRKYPKATLAISLGTCGLLLNMAMAYTGYCNAETTKAQVQAARAKAVQTIETEKSRLNNKLDELISAHREDAPTVRRMLEELKRENVAAFDRLTGLPVGETGDYVNRNTAEVVEAGVVAMTTELRTSASSLHRDIEGGLVLELGAIERLREQVDAGLVTELEALGALRAAADAGSGQLGALADQIEAGLQGVHSRFNSLQGTDEAGALVTLAEVLNELQRLRLDCKSAAISTALTDGGAGSPGESNASVAGPI